jgi:ABC-type glycerol-3-phosphate transport system substrate-binding protein
MILRRTFLTALAVLVLAGCGGGGEKAPAGDASAPAPDANGSAFKIGIMTGTVSQGEDEFRAAQMIAAKYPGRVKHVTYPDNFMNEQETTISQLVGLASDPDVKVIVASQAVPGSIAALRKIRENRPDILIGFVEAHEDPALVNASADIAIQPDQLARGNTIIAVAKQMGVKNFVHYSFPRHMSQELLARRRDIMKTACDANGIAFHFVTAPDPMAEGGLPATQQFVLEDVPREIQKLGPETASSRPTAG